MKLMGWAEPVAPTQATVRIRFHQANGLTAVWQTTSTVAKKDTPGEQRGPAKSGSSRHPISGIGRKDAQGKGRFADKNLFFVFPGIFFLPRRTFAIRTTFIRADSVRNVGDGRPTNHAAADFSHSSTPHR